MFLSEQSGMSKVTSVRSALFWPDTGSQSFCHLFIAL